MNLEYLGNRAKQQSGAVEACWAHNPEVRRSKLRSANIYSIEKHFSETDRNNSEKRENEIKKIEKKIRIEQKKDIIRKNGNDTTKE